MAELLPPGQRPAPLRRFGLPQFAGVSPQPPEHPVVTVTGAVRRPLQLSLTEICDHPSRCEHCSDLHCVTTWSARGLRWGGLPFSSLRLDDCLAADVLLADALNGAPLTPDAGAPLRLVAPAHYGYKSVKHLYAIEYRCHYDPGPAGWMGHPRGRVAYEERSRYLPGRAWRPVWRLALPLVRRTYDRQPRG